MDLEEAKADHKYDDSTWLPRGSSELSRSLRFAEVAQRDGRHRRAKSRGGSSDLSRSLRFAEVAQRNSWPGKSAVVSRTASADSFDVKHQYQKHQQQRSGEADGCAKSDCGNGGIINHDQVRICADRGRGREKGEVERDGERSRGVVARWY